jgi:small subunit ribosomal protein S18
MAQKSSSAKPRKRRSGGFRRTRRKVCALCVEKDAYLDYKNIARLKRFVSERGKILPRRSTGACAMHQRVVAEAIKRARHVALLPFVAE